MQTLRYKEYEIRQLGPALWEVPRTGRMRVPARIFATEEQLRQMMDDNAIQQAINVACLPGIVGYSLAMPDIHWGYGFPIGGVAAFDLEEGVVSPGGVGYDINCGVRLLASRLNRERFLPYLRPVLDAMFRKVPTGVGKGGFLELDQREMRQVLTEGARWALGRGYGEEGDLRHVEEGGRIAGADPDAVSARAIERGSKQLGTLGSGNHFAEIGWVDRLYDERAAARLGLEEGTVTVLIHSGSRGCGYQICDDTLKELRRAAKKWDFELPDPQLAAAPIRSPEGQKYLRAMRCGINYAFANRQIIAHRVREAFREGMGASDAEIGLRVVYEVAHNIAKVEEHQLDGERRKLLVHRKGATRAFGPGHPEIPEDYRDLGQPVLIPGDMGRYSFVLLGTEDAMRQTFGSTCHGAGRVQSRTAAKKAARGRDLRRELEQKSGVLVRAAGYATIAEEMPEAYKDVAGVVEACAAAGISRIVARIRPLGVIKG
ncbi:MAG: RNA-splicing ligase RtcB [Planctomycetota bacterium]|nr:MAG: RNA-splicing ligase RtcB [Planctomycetota bacterium]